MKKLISLFSLIAFIFAFSAVKASAVAQNWNLAGNWKIDFAVDGSGYDANLYDLTLTQSGDVLSGLGQYPSPSPYAYAWTVTGAISGDSFTLVDTYTQGAVGTVMNMTGTVALDGTISGSWNDNYGGYRSGTWKTNSGTATAIVVACPAGTTKSSTFLGTVSVLPTGNSYLSSSLTNGVTYILEAGGTYVFAPGMNPPAGIADAAYNLRPEGWVNGSIWSAPYTSLLELWVNDSAVDWGAFNASHVYTTSLVGAGASASFKILDDGYGDNSGNLTVNIYSCNPDKPSLPTDKDQCKKDGWKVFGVFKNQGDCVSYVATGGKNLPASK
jgi:hypothetical protein